MKTCVICISKNAHDTINDWIEHYFSIGFDHIFLFDNNDFDKRYKIEDERVSLIPYYGFPIYEGSPEWRQAVICKIGLMFGYNQYYRCAFICDDDEYLNLNNKYKDIKDFLNHYSGYESFRIHEKVINDNGYIYISDEPEHNKLNDIYTKANKESKYFKSLSTLPWHNDDFVKLIYYYNTFIMHSVYMDNFLDIDINDIYYNHYKTYCLERFLIKKSKIKGNTAIMTDNLLGYFLDINECTDEKLKAYVDICKKYDITISEKDKKILDDHNIKY